MNDWYVEETLKNYARIIKAYCKKNTCCDDCPFRDENAEIDWCKLTSTDETPAMWEV